MAELEEIGNGSLSGLENLNELYLTNNVKLRSIHEDALSRLDVENQRWPPINKVFCFSRKMRFAENFVLFVVSHLL